MTTLKTRVKDAVLTAIESFVTPQVELAVKSVIESSGRNADSNVLNPGRREFSGIVEGLQMTTASRVNSHIDLG